jgi:hypothetical protein
MFDRLLQNGQYLPIYERELVDRRQDNQVAVPFDEPCVVRYHRNLAVGRLSQPLSRERAADVLGLV